MTSADPVRTPLVDVHAHFLTGHYVQAAKLEYALDQLGCDGVTTETNTEGIYLGDPRYQPLLAELDQRRTPVFVHPTSPPNYEAVSLGRPRAMLEFLFDATRTVSDLAFTGRLQRYPNIPWIVTHGGGDLPLLTQRMELFRSVVPVEGTTAADPAVPIPEQVSRLWFDMAGTPFPNQIPALTAAFGSQRLLYGSDYCWTPAAGTTAQVRSIDAAPQPDDDTWRALTTRNAQRLFSRLNDLT